MSILHYAERLPLRVPPRDVWRFLFDTDRLNKSLKLPSIDYAPHPDKRLKGHYRAEAKVGPLRLVYEEFPFEWVERRYYRVLRRFQSGPFVEFRGGIRMRPADGGTELEVFAEAVPRGVVGRVLAPSLLKKAGLDAIVKQVKAFEAGFLAAERTAPPIAKGELSMSQLEERARVLASAPVRRDLVARLRETLLTASDIEVTQLRPFEQADRWGADRFETLILFLHATKAGLVDLKWQIICPHCRAPSETGASLADLKTKSVCATCETEFGVDLANSVEAVFSVNPGVRSARSRTFCIGGPANTPRVLAQLRLDPGEERRETVEGDPGLLTVRAYQSKGLLPLEVMESGAAEVKIVCGDDLMVSSARMAPGSAAVSVKNERDGECLLVFERETWRETAATAAVVSTIQEFRDLFPREAVAPGQEIAVGRLSVLFTDLQGSTDLYERIGDVKAFDFVQSHFQFLIRLIAKHRGGVVKTMGDAIMAAFNDGKDAVSAAVAMQEDWVSFMERYRLPAQVGLKVGVHQGAAVAFNNKGLLDYFGTMVNTAARIQAQAVGGDIVVSEAIRNDPDARRLIEARFAKIEVFSARLKGITGEQTLHRLRLPKK